MECNQKEINKLFIDIDWCITSCKSNKIPLIQCRVKVCTKNARKSKRAWEKVVIQTEKYALLLTFSHRLRQSAMEHGKISNLVMQLIINIGNYKKKCSKYLRNLEKPNDVIEKSLFSPKFCVAKQNRKRVAHVSQEINRIGLFALAFKPWQR